ncbi:hypothetical protein RI030_09515 [Aphanizomenon flos-aquae NRERC-008]|jgi:hypothetical protein|uniref:Uncharacterized protein n=1 Tax=Aphanizomenon flos-aquae FACHB-1249 TaxID=2692889 RepID=A0ABR8IRJ2_APHFL|nr:MULTISPECIES: hypothetical protein [Aphanizomenon]MBD2389773.1 hypothetical protein [Aphanizomenon flos-aquae FACHB-1171]MBD2556962.1 hypothetical protein [Aphanizomenon flos-aquae FACHB-1290]MBD2631312.1 hypothetical protein [Aphanizomenon sp. FACHB-1399]MBD2643012.1 hypothetical protein [Aphanizomenon sp. FACHB-1401]MBD2656006.1 hypothetical protein [Aphanizomenon flos-aquae FACHB-1265]
MREQRTGNRKEKQEGGTAEGKPITNYQLPITNYQLPITNYQLPITNYQLPIIQTKEILIGIHCCTIRNI